MLFILKNHYQKGVIERKLYYRITVKNLCMVLLSHNRPIFCNGLLEFPVFVKCVLWHPCRFHKSGY